MPNGERPLCRSRCTAKHRGCKGRATSDGQASTRHEQGRIRWECSRAGVDSHRRCLGRAAGGRGAAWLGRPTLVARPPAHRWLGRPPTAARPPGAAWRRARCLARPPGAAWRPARCLARPPARSCLASPPASGGSAARPTLARRGRTPHAAGRLCTGRRAGGRKERRSAAAVE